MSDRSAKSMKPPRISFYGNFGAGNLGNECTLQAIIEQTLQRWPDARLLSFCTNPQDVRTRHNIAAFASEAVEKTAAKRSGSRGLRGRLARIFRIAFQRIPLELVHWVKSLRVVGRTDMLIVAGTGIIADYLTGPLGWPYDIFKLSTLAALCRVKLVFLSVGVGPIHHPLSRWFLKRSLGLARHRSYRHEASKQYLEKIGFNTARDFVYPDVVFGLSQGNLGLWCSGRSEASRWTGTQGLRIGGTTGAEGISRIPGYDGGLRLLAPGAWLRCAVTHRRHSVRYLYKQGKFLPGTHRPICTPQKIEETKPDYVLILPWNFQDKIMAQMAHIRKWGGRFMTPIPQVKVYP